MFLVQCPKCKQRMKYQPQKKLGKKRCVYCGHTFTVHSNPNKSNIVKEL